MIRRTTTTTVKRGDTAPALVVYCYDNDQPINLDQALSVRVLGTRDGSMAVDGTGEVTDSPAGQITYTWQAGDTDVVGDLLMEIEVTWNDGTKQTFPGSGWLVVTVLPDLT